MKYFNLHPHNEVGGCARFSRMWPTGGGCRVRHFKGLGWELEKYCSKHPSRTNGSVIKAFLVL